MVIPDVWLHTREARERLNSAGYFTRLESAKIHLISKTFGIVGCITIHKWGVDERAVERFENR